jgi:hypothetical protein
MGIPSDRRFLALARRQIGHLFPHLPERTAYHKRRRRLSRQTEALIAEFARRSPGYVDDLLLVDSTPAECARSRETVKRGGSSSLADALRPGVRGRARRARRDDPASPPQGRETPRSQHRSTLDIEHPGTQTGIADHPAAPPHQQPTPRTASRADPPTHREHFLDLQRHPHPRTPRRPHARQPPRPPVRPVRRPGCRRHAQPPTRPPHPRPGRLHRINPWHQSSRGASVQSQGEPMQCRHAVIIEDYPVRARNAPTASAYSSDSIATACSSRSRCN